jgi:hypothetical protein
MTYSPTEIALIVVAYLCAVICLTVIAAKNRTEFAWLVAIFLIIALLLIIK